MKRNMKYSLTWLGIAVVAYVVLYSLYFFGFINFFIENAMITIGINIILATGLNLILGVSGQFSLGHAGFMAIGAYSTAIISIQNPTAAGFISGILLGIALSGLVALLVGIPTLRLKGDYLAIATLGVSEIIRYVIISMNDVTNGASGLYGIPPFTNWLTVFVAIVVTTLIIVNYIHSGPGRATLSIREDEIAAESMGVNTTKYKVLAFVIGAMTASVAGAIHATYIQTIAPKEFGFMKSVDILIIVVFGGIGSITGTFIAAILLGILNIYLQNFGELRMIIYSLALIIIMVFKPSGLLGNWEFSVKPILDKFDKKHKEKTQSELLIVKNLTKNFGGLAAVSNVNIELRKNELVGLIGPNGAGKTTLFNLLTGVYPPSEGKIELEVDGKAELLNGKKPYKIAALGLGRTFQNIRLFKELTVLDNVLIAMNDKHKESVFSSILRRPSFYKKEMEMKKKVVELLSIFNMENKLETLAKNLPYGEQRRLEIVRALATEPKVLFLDEPAAGMNPQETADLTLLIRKIQKEFEITILLIEHDMSLVMEVCVRLYVLEYGQIIAQGNPEEIKNNPRVIEAYLGGEL